MYVFELQWIHFHPSFSRIETSSQFYNFVCGFFANIIHVILIGVYNVEFLCFMIERNFSDFPSAEHSGEQYIDRALGGGNSVLQ